jgi:hypothetical protein
MSSLMAIGYRKLLASNVTVVAMAGLILWLAAVALGFRALLSYENTPGPRAASPYHWPSGSQMSLDSTSPTLVLFVHPHCPCSRASIAELASIISKIPGRLSVRVMMYQPANASPEWRQTDLWRAAQKLSGVTVVPDRDGEEATRFDASISGQAMLYNPQGRLLFSGGITKARGHVGDNAGYAAIISLIISGRSAQVTTPVFGCHLRTHDSLRDGKL